MESKAFVKLKDYIQPHIIEKGSIMKMNTVLEVYKNLITQYNEEESGLKTQNLKLRLQNHFGDKLSFWVPKGKGGIVYSEEAPSTMESAYQNAHTDIVADCGKIIRDEILNLPDSFSHWPPAQKELLSHNVSIPPMLEKLLFTIISSKKEKTERKSRLVKSIGQDLIYNASHGKKKTLKHTQLGIALKRKTGSRQILQWLNRFGHSISYNEVNVVETKLGEEQTNLEFCRKYVPNNIQPGTMVTFVYDNCDHNVESLHGLTMHCTNGIVIQRSAPNLPNITTELAIPSPSMVRMPRKWSFKPAYNELQPYVKSKDKDSPSLIVDADENSNNLSELISKRQDDVWYLSRYNSVFKQGQEQKLPSWKGFFHLVTPKNRNIQHTISYLPSINDSPTKYEVVQEILLQCKEKAEKLNLDVADLVLDHAIYSKALEVLFKEGNEDLKSFFNLRMGGFHTSCIFLGVIGKRFGDAGLKDLIIESGLLGEGSVELEALIEYLQIKR